MAREAWGQYPWAWLWVAPVGSVLTFLLWSRLSAIVAAVVLGVAVVARLSVQSTVWTLDLESELGTIARALFLFVFAPRSSHPPFHVTALIALTGVWLFVGLSPGGRAS
jgi:hypothetical protein